MATEEKEGAAVGKNSYVDSRTSLCALFSPQGCLARRSLPRGATGWQARCEGGSPLRPPPAAFPLSASPSRGSSGFDRPRFCTAFLRTSLPANPATPRSSRPNTCVFVQSGGCVRWDPAKSPVAAPLETGDLTAAKAAVESSPLRARLCWNQRVGPQNARGLLVVVACFSCSLGPSRCEPSPPMHLHSDASPSLINGAGTLVGDFRVTLLRSYATWSSPDSAWDSAATCNVIAAAAPLLMSLSYCTGAIVGNYSRTF